MINSALTVVPLTHVVVDAFRPIARRLVRKLAAAIGRPFQPCAEGTFQKLGALYRGAQGADAHSRCESSNEESLHCPTRGNFYEVNKVQPLQKYVSLASGLRVCSLCETLYRELYDERVLLTEIFSLQKNGEGTRSRYRSWHNLFLRRRFPARQSRDHRQ